MHLGGQLVEGGRQRGFVLLAAVLMRIQPGLRVLDAHAHRKALGFEGGAGSGSHAQRIQRRVTGGQDHRIGGDLFAVGQLHAGHAWRIARFGQQFDHLGTKAHFARLQQRLAHGFNHLGQAVRTNVRAP